jgi:hypothetical protein
MPTRAEILDTLAASQTAGHGVFSRAEPGRLGAPGNGE